MSKIKIETQNGTLTDKDFFNEAPLIGSADKKYSEEDLEELTKLAEELKSKVPSK